MRGFWCIQPFGEFYTLTKQEQEDYRKLAYIQQEEIIKTQGCHLIDEKLGTHIKGNTFEELQKAVRTLWNDKNKDFIIFKIYKRRGTGNNVYIGVTIQSEYTLNLWDTKYIVECESVCCYAVTLYAYNNELKQYRQKIPIKEF